jgi:hypothetical protein
MDRDWPDIVSHVVRAIAARPKRRKSRLNTIIDRARKAGAVSVTTPEGFTYTLGTPAVPENAFEERLGKLSKK